MTLKLIIAATWERYIFIYLLGEGRPLPLPELPDPENPVEAAMENIMVWCMV